jgi:photosystem II stability/assembly factor-like uncharacterized protein
VTTAPASFQIDPLIAAARQRQRRRRLALATVLLLATAAGISAWRLTTTPSSAPSVAAARHQIEIAAHKAMIVNAGITGGVGWAMNGIGIWASADGGRTWLTATPRHVRNIGDPVARVGQIQFVDSRHGWLTAGDVFGGFRIPRGAPSLRHMEIDRTSDGGRTWQASAPPGCLQTCGDAHVSFLNARDGFALTTKGLFSTRDAGATWSRVSRPPFTGAFTFLDARRGFGVNDPTSWTGPQHDVPVGGDVLYRTDDGGLHWSLVVLPAPAAYASWPRTVDPVTFFAQHGVAPVRFRNPKTHAERLVVYLTTDGGVTWTARPAPTNVKWWPPNWGVPVTSYFSAATPLDWVVTDRSVLHITTNGGRSWRTFRPRDLPTGGTIWQAVFSSADDGWAIFALPGQNGSAALVHTVDGGLDWTPLLPPVPKPKPVTPPKPKCGSACQRP